MRMLGMLPVESVRPNTWNVNAIPDEEYAKLKEAIRASGPERMEPITVRRAEDEALEIVDGEQRWKIAKELGWKAIPAVEVDVDRKEAKFLCLSYNALRGTVNLVKLADLLAADPEMVEVTLRLYGREKTVELIESSKNLSEEAKEMLLKGLKSGATVTLDRIKAVAETPKNLQYVAARAATSKTLAERFIKSSVEQFIHPKREETKEERREEREKEERREVAEKRVSEEKREPEKKEPEKPYIVGAKAYEIGSYVKIDGKTFLIYFDPEKKAVGIAEHKLITTTTRTGSQLQNTTCSISSARSAGQHTL